MANTAVVVENGMDVAVVEILLAADEKISMVEIMVETVAKDTRLAEVMAEKHSTKSVCHRCGMGNHWAKTCRTPKHLVDLYQESLKGKNPEAHMTYQDGEDDFNHDQDDLMDYETSDCLKD